MSQGVVYMLWGQNHERLLARSLASLQKHHPDIPVHVHREPVAADDPEIDGRHHPKTLLLKTKMHDVSPFDTTIYLDTDTVVLGDISSLFDVAEKYGLACGINECPWARRYGGLADSGDIREFNTGVMAFNRDTVPGQSHFGSIGNLFFHWKSLAADMDSSIVFAGPNGTERMPCNDQASFAAACHSTSFNPYVLPMNWNFRPMWHRSWFGPIKIFHNYSDPPQALIDASEQQSKPGEMIRYFQSAISPKPN